jgi:hypothetical protein
MSKDSQRFTSSAARVLALLVVILIGLTFMTDRLITSSENQVFRDQYKEIELDMEESMVVSLLGAPNDRLGAPKDRSPEFNQGQSKDFEESYRRAAESDAAYYLIWNLEPDEVYAIGFNEEEQVVIVEAGGR